MFFTLTLVVFFLADVNAQGASMINLPPWAKAIFMAFNEEWNPDLEWSTILAEQAVRESLIARMLCTSCNLKIQGKSRFGNASHLEQEVNKTLTTLFKEKGPEVSRLGCENYGCNGFYIELQLGGHCMLYLSCIYEGSKLV